MKILLVFLFSTIFAVQAISFFDLVLEEWTTYKVTLKIKVYFLNFY